MTSRSPTSPDLLIGRTVGTHYVISKLLGRGVRSATYLAEHRSLHRDVVVKLLDDPWSGDSEAASRFDQAARSLSTFEAPNIAALIDSGRDPGRGIFVVTELVVGDSLETFLGARGALSIEEFVPIAAQILKGLGAAHLRGLLHLDITLNNIYLCKDEHAPSRGLVRLLDLGLVQLVEGHVQGHVPGLEAPSTGDTRYLAPEQISNKPLDTRTDVYAVGALFYQMLAGLPPFVGTDEQIIYKHINERPTSLAEHVEEPLPSELIELIESCLSKDPDERPVDANEVVELLIDSVPAALFRGYVPPPNIVEATVRGDDDGDDDDDDAEDLSDALEDDEDDEDGSDSAAVAAVAVAATRSGDEPTGDAATESSKRRPAIGDLNLGGPSAVAKSWEVADDPAAESTSSAPIHSEAIAEPVAEPEEEEKKGGGMGFFIFLLLVAAVVGAIFVLKPELLGLAPPQPQAQPPVTPEQPEVAVEDIGTLLVKARALEGEGDIVGARALYHQILATDPMHAEASDRLAVLRGDEVSATTTGATTSVTSTTSGAAGTSTGGETEASTGETGTTGEATDTGSGSDSETTEGTGSTGAEVAPPPAGKANVEFTVKPRGTLFVDGKKAGRVPGTLSLPLGEHTLRIEGSERHKPWEEKVEIRAGMAPMEITLKRKPKDLSGENVDIDPMVDGPATEFKFKK